MDELPALDSAFCAGEISWTQLRLLRRVATPADQGEWLAMARGPTARELAREVRAVDRRAREPLSLAEDDEAGREGVLLRLSRRARARWWSARQVASRVAGHALSHGAFAEVLAAEVVSGVPLEGEFEPESTDSSRARESRLPRLSSARCPSRRVSPGSALAVYGPGEVRC